MLKDFDFYDEYFVEVIEQDFLTGYTRWGETMLLAQEAGAPMYDDRQALELDEYFESNPEIFNTLCDSLTQYFERAVNGEIGRGFADFMRDNTRLFLTREERSLD